MTTEEAGVKRSQEMYKITKVMKAPDVVISRNGRRHIRLY